MTLILVIDTGSATSSVALAEPGRVLSERRLAGLRTAEFLLPAIDEVLAEAGVGLRALTGVVALRGPGSFTGLRIGLATVLGLRQALRIPATAVPTLAVLAAATGADLSAPDEWVVAAVDALRGAWFAQRFRPDGDRLPAAGDEAARVPAGALAELGPGPLVGFGVAALLPELLAGLRPVEPPGLAGVAARLAAGGCVDWDPATLTAPLYLSPPAITLPRR